MAEYFTALADQSVDKPENLSQSYRWYTQAREVRSILGLPAASSTKLPQLASQLDNQYKSLKEAGEQPAALAYLYALQDFDARRPGLRKLINDQETVVRDGAVKRLSTTDFQSRYSDQDYGDVISTFITQYLFEHVPHDVRIVEREQYEAIQREREISGDSAALASVNLLVSGSVLESKVDSSEAKNKKMMRVTVGKESIPNPAYVSWLKLPSKERKKVEQPSETIDVDKHENVSVEMTRHRKVGIFSVSYRLVEATTGRVIFPDSITVDSRHEDESNEGVEMGDFVIAAKLADLPSDVEILDDLAKKVATEIGKKLVEELKDQELKYLASAEQSAGQNDCVGEVESLGNALMITRLKAKDSTELYSKFKKGAVACY
jgi:curli biogenesis system outer membrane secretion channel CsgG